MPKTTFAKLTKTISSENYKTFHLNDEEIKIKLYLPIQDKLTLISNIINAAADGNRFVNTLKLEMFIKVYMLYSYTDITFTDKQKEEPTKIYDTLQSCDYLDAILEAIPKAEREIITENVVRTAANIYEQQNSIYGILDSLNTDYSNLDLDIQKLMAQISNGKEDISLVNDIVTKLG